MEVIKDPLSWWWSSEICLITVGPWALFLYLESIRLRIRHVWVFMALGQLVAISFAFNLFSLAIVYRLGTTLLIESPVRVTQSVDPQYESNGNAEKVITTVTLRRTPLPGQGWRDGLVSQDLALWILVAAGLSSVLQHPDSFTKVMIMHVFPMLIVLYPRTQAQQDGVQHSWIPAPKALYLLLGTVSVHLRFSLTYQCVRLLDSAAGATSRVHTAQRLVQALFPSTFLRHPAQSSISSDHLCVAISTLAFITVESGLWLNRCAIAKTASNRRVPDKMGLGAVERDASLVLALLLLSPFVGPSATLAFYLALRCNWVNQHEQHLQTLSDRIHSNVQQERTGSILSRQKTREIIQTQDGQRLVEVCETTVVHYPPL